ncbi:MAG: HAD hydrolase family protein [Candidatus Aminicenantes bacterium]|nr:HAD hydrolase family protein [Candidatus Aminicenantes bacterium]
MHLIKKFKAWKAAKKIELVLMDVDGTLTDGCLYVLPDGQEVKGYHVRDGLGILLARLAGLKTGIITGKSSPALSIRAERLGLDEIHQNILDKEQILKDILERHRLSPGQLAFIGDDLGDLKIMKAVGLSAAPADAHPQVKKIALYICRNKGGYGAVREFLEFILRAQKKWAKVAQRTADIKNGLNR